MFYRDALNGMYTFGGIYAAGVLGWSVVEVGTFGIIAIIAGALFAWLGGMADTRFGPKPVIAFCILALTAVAISVVMVSRESVFGIAVGIGLSYHRRPACRLQRSTRRADGRAQDVERDVRQRAVRPNRDAKHRFP